MDLQEAFLHDGGLRAGLLDRDASASPGCSSVSWCVVVYCAMSFLVCVMSHRHEMKWIWKKPTSEGPD